jgi:hypothetical protein
MFIGYNKNKIKQFSLPRIAFILPKLAVGYQRMHPVVKEQFVIKDHKKCIFTKIRTCLGLQNLGC